MSLRVDALSLSNESGGLPPCFASGAQFFTSITEKRGVAAKVSCANQSWEI